MDTQKKVNIMIVVLLSFVVIFGVFFYFKGKTLPKDSFIYKNGDQEYEVTRVQDQLSVNYDLKIFVGKSQIPYIVTVRHDPNDLQKIPVDNGIRKKIWDAKEVFLTINPNLNLTGKTTIAALEIDKFFDNKYFLNKPTKSAFTEIYAKDANHTIKTCKDAANSTAVVWLRTGAETKVFTEEGCVVVQGIDEDNMIRAADRLALYSIGIMN